MLQIHSAWYFSKCLVSDSEKEILIPVVHPASLFYPGSVCWKLWMLHVSFNKQISPVGKYETQRRHRHLGLSNEHPFVLRRDVIASCICATSAFIQWSFFPQKSRWMLLFFMLDDNKLQSGFIWLCLINICTFLPSPQHRDFVLLLLSLSQCFLPSEYLKKTLSAVCHRSQS